MAWIALLGAAVSAGAGIYSSNRASGAQKRAGDQNAQLQRDMFGAQLQMYEPARALGYGAMNDLAALYGYNIGPYSPLEQLMGGGYGGSNNYILNKFSSYGPNGLIRVDGKANQGNGPMNNSGGWATFSGGSQRRKFGGYIDLVSGTVSIPGQEERSALLTQYLRTGQGVTRDNNPKLGRFIAEIDSLRAQGYQYDPNAAAEAAARANASPAADRASTPGGPNAMLERLQQMPGYQFGLQQGQRNLDQSAAARGGVLSGNAVKAATQFGIDYSGTKLDQEINRLLAMAGLGQTATAGTSNAATNATQGISQANTQIGDARASGIMGIGNSIANGINTGLNLYSFQRQMRQPSTYAPSSYGSNYNTSLFSGSPSFAPGSWDYLNANKGSY